MKNRKRIGAVWIGGLCGTALLLCGAAAANESVAEQSGASVTIEIDYGDCDVRRENRILCSAASLPTKTATA